MERGHGEGACDRGHLQESTRKLMYNASGREFFHKSLIFWLCIMKRIRFWYLFILSTFVFSHFILSWYKTKQKIKKKWCFYPQGSSWPAILSGLRSYFLLKFQVNSKDSSSLFSNMQSCFMIFLCYTGGALINPGYRWLLLIRSIWLGFFLILKLRLCRGLGGRGFGFFDVWCYENLAEVIIEDMVLQNDFFGLPRP